MFSLIISIIAIALVAALAAASVYYGGSAFNKGTAGADASTFINNGQQINGAWTLASTDGHTPSAVSDLVDGINGDVYLSQAPSYKGTALTLASAPNDNYVSVTVSTQVCDEINDRAGIDTAPVSGATIASLFACDADLNAYYKVK